MVTITGRNRSRRLEYFANRQNSMWKEIADEEVNNKLGIVAKFFSLEWLATVDNHPLQVLWQRSDWVSTIELYTLGYALSELDLISSTWVLYQVEQAKSSDPCTRRGALFELVGIQMLRTKMGTRAIPTPPGAPGIDCTLRIDSESMMRFNLKTFGLTSKHAEFLHESKTTRTTLVSELYRRRTAPIHVLMISEGKYPTSEEWVALRSIIPTIPNPIPSYPRCLKNEPLWDFIIAPLELAGTSFSEEHLSYSLMISTGRYKNEDINIRSKLESGLADLERAEACDSQCCLDLLFVRIPVSVSISAIERITKQLFCDFQFDHAAGIILYQPDIAKTKPQSQIRALHHCFKFVHNPKHVDKRSRILANMLNLQIPVGINTYTPVQTAFTSGNEQFNLDDIYMYQYGEIYIKASRECDGKQRCNFIKLGPGIKVYGVFEPMLEGQKGLQASIIDDDRLVILQESIFSDY